jgi:MFS family permease
VAEAGFGIGLSIRASLKYIILNEISYAERATSLGMLIIFISLGQITGASLIEIVISGSNGESSGFRIAFLLLTALTLALLILSLFLKNRDKEKNSITA